MKRDTWAVLLIVTAGFIFNTVFWQEKMALNTIFFDAFVLASLFVLYPQAKGRREVMWLLAGHLLSVAMVVIHNTPVSKWSFLVTLALVSAFAEYSHRSAWYAGGSLLMNAIYFLRGFITRLFRMRQGKGQGRRVSKWIRFAIFPILIVAVFFMIYSAANSVFGNIAGRVELRLENWLASFVNLFQFERILFLMVGLYASGIVLLKSDRQTFAAREALRSDDLKRIRKPLFQRMHSPFLGAITMVMGRFAKGMLALRNENTTGIISLALLNGLLVMINLIDISYLWIGFDYMGDVHLQQMLHEGAELLIFSIVLAMMILLFFFKGNLNFYRRNKWLKYGAYAWIVQNMVLVVSVLLRDYYYIQRYGLAYKRIGVLFFLSMVLIGLVTVFMKIRYKKTSYFLFRVNAWAGLIILVLSSTIHWDEMIAAYNLSHRDRVPLDRSFLLSLSDKTIPLLEQNRDALQQEDRVVLAEKERVFVAHQQYLSWLSWNYADAFTENYLRKKGSISHR